MAVKKPKDLGGRPTKHTLELADLICRDIASGMSMKRACAGKDRPDMSTIFRWIHSDREGFCKEYENACKERSEAHAEEILDIADDSAEDKDADGKVRNDTVQRARLRVDTRKWLMSKLVPKKYGDKIQHSGDEDNPVNVIVRKIIK